MCLSKVPEGRARRRKQGVISANTNIKAEHFPEIMKEWFASRRLQFPGKITKTFYTYTYTKAKLQNIKNTEAFQEESVKSDRLPWARD